MNLIWYSLCLLRVVLVNDISVRKDTIGYKQKIEKSQLKNHYVHSLEAVLLITRNNLQKSFFFILCCFYARTLSSLLLFFFTRPANLLKQLLNSTAPLKFIWGLTHKCLVTHNKWHWQTVKTQIRRHNTPHPYAYFCLK